MNGTGEDRKGKRDGWPAGLTAVLTFLIALVVLLLLVRSDPDRVPLEDAVSEKNVLDFEAEVLGAMGDLVVRPVHGLRVRASNVVWLDGRGQRWLESPRVAFSVQVGALLGGAIVVSDGVIDAPRLRLVQIAPGRWNYEHPLAPLLAPADPQRPELATEVRLRNLVVRNGEVSLVRADATYRATALRATLASAVLAGPGVREPRFHLSRAEATVVLPDTAHGQFSRFVVVDDARLTLPTGAVGFDVARLTFGSSVASGLVGRWDPALGGLGLGAVATIERLELADVPWLRVEAPEDAVASGRLRIEPLPGDRSAVVLTGLDIRSETSAATGSLRLVFGPAGALALESIDMTLDPLALSLVEAFTGPLPYVGDLRGTVRGTAGDIAFDVRASLATTPAADRFTIDLTGRMAFRDVGMELRGVTAELRAVPLAALAPFAPGLPLRGPVSGTIRLDGAPGQVPIRLDVRLEAGGGVVTVAGTVDLRGPVPAYDLTGRLVGVELQRVLVPAAPPAQVNATFALAGRGTTLPDATAMLRLDGSFTGWQAAPGDTIALDVQLVEGLVVAEQVRLALGPIDLVADGTWRFAHGEGGAIRYSASIASLEPLSPYLPRGPEGALRFARGALDAQGTLSGTLDAPALAGTIRAVDFWFGDWSAARLDGTYDVRLGPGLPHAVVHATGVNVRTPGGDFATAVLALDFTRPTFDVQFHGDRMAGLGVVQVEAGGQVDETGVRDVVIRVIEVDLDQARWRLVAPARIEWLAGDVVQVTDFRLEQVDGEGRVRLDGVIAPADLTDLAVDVAAVPIGDLIALVRAGLDIDGDLWLQGTLRGPAASPSLTAEAELRDGVIQGVEIQHLRANLTFMDGTLALVGDGLLGDMARFDMEGTVPLALTLGLPPSFELIAEAPIRGRLRTDNFAMSALGPALPGVRDLEGWLTANLAIDGTPLDPVLSGTASLREGAVTVDIASQRYRDIEANATLEGEILRLERLVARSDGLASVTGTIRFEDLVNPVLDLTADLQRFRAQGVPGRRDAALTGRLAIGGTPASPLLSGRLLVHDGTVNLTMIQPPGHFSEDLIGIAERFDPLGPVDFDLLDPAETGIRISRLDLAVGGDVWFQSDEMRAQLQGDLVIQKPAQEVMISGNLTGERGTFSLRIGPATRRFDIIDANIQFFGTPGPDPALDITAARVIPGPNRTDFEIRVRLSGTLSSPSVAFATEDGTSIPESEALNFLIFGRATATLGDFPGAGFGTTQGVYDALAFYGAFDFLSDALAERFGAGIDYFQVQVRSGFGDFGPEMYFLLGHEVIEDVFVLVTLPTTEFEARWAVTAEWRIDRQWTLEAGYEPPDMVIGVPGRRLPFAVERDQQLFFSIRRRWTY
jgi:hypothetical protein